jgi:hypothetical protein
LLPSPTPTAILTEKPTKFLVQTENPTEIVTCKKKKVTLTVEVETDGDETNIIWYLTNIRKQKVSHRSTYFKSFDEVNTCVGSGSCFTFTIENSGNAADHRGQYKVYADGNVVASGSTFDKITRHNISINSKKKFNIRFSGLKQRKGCLWLEKKKKKNRFCNKFSKLRSKCPETCGSCNY